MRCVLITRPEPFAKRTAETLVAKGLKCLIDPLTIIISTLEPFITKRPQAWVLTSQNAVPSLKRVAAPDELVIAVGDTTTQLLKQEGFQRAINAGGSVYLLKEWICSNQQPENGPIYYLSGQEVTETLEDLSPFVINRFVVYEARLQEPMAATKQALQAGEVDEVWFYSSRVAAHFMRWAHQQNIALDNLTAKCLSEKIQYLCRQGGWGSVKLIDL